jgi:hypothetical protein
MTGRQHHESDAEKGRAGARDIDWTRAGIYVSVTKLLKSKQKVSEGMPVGASAAELVFDHRVEHREIDGFGFAQPVQRAAGAGEGAR